MKRPGSRHYTEEELLMHYLQEETAAVGEEISRHLPECDECGAIFNEYRDVVLRIQAWGAPVLSEEIWQARKGALLAQFRADRKKRARGGFFPSLQARLSAGWNYALENPLPTLAYIAVAVAFAVERTVTTLRLEQVLPGAGEVLEILRQVF